MRCLSFSYITSDLIPSQELSAQHRDSGRTQDPAALTHQIEAHLANENYNGAFEVALGAQNLEIFSWTLSITTPEEAFSKSTLVVVVVVVFFVVVVVVVVAVVVSRLFWLYCF
jgi:hypothetical protein